MNKKRYVIIGGRPSMPTVVITMAILSLGLAPVSRFVVGIIVLLMLVGMVLEDRRARLSLLQEGTAPHHMPNDRADV